MPRAGPLATSLLVLFAGGVAAVAAAEVTAAPATRSTPDDDAARWTSWVDWPLPDPDRHTVAFPVGEIFTPPLADQKQPRFHTTLQLWKTAGGDFTVGSVAYGENLPLLVMGGGAGTLKGGRHLRYTDKQSMANLLMTLMDKMDVPVERIGGSTGKVQLDALSL